MARIIQIPPNMSLSTALRYFSGELPNKETGWLELLGTVSGLQTAPGQFVKSEGILNLTHCVCVLSSANQTTNGIVSNSIGHVVHSGPIHDFIAGSIQGRLTMMPQTPWSPPSEGLEKTGLGPKDTMSLDSKAVSWGDLAQLSKENASTPTPAQASTKHEKNVSETPAATFAVGDVMMHPRFGRCKIVRAPAFGKVKIRKPSGAFSDLHLKVVRIVQVENTHNGRVFHVQIGPV